MSVPVKLTPMLKQYFDLKQKYSDCILFFRLGDFYEMFGDDALEVSKILSITLTSRGQDESKIAMCGVPHHAARRYIAKLTKLGKRVAMCEQLTDPNLPGIVQRDVVKIISPGTTFDDYLLDEKTNNYIASLCFENEKFALAFCDLTTGEFCATELKNFYELESEINKLTPAELILSLNLFSTDSIKLFLEKFSFLYLTPISSEVSESRDFILKHFGIKNLEAFCLEEEPLSVAASANLIDYLKNSQKSELLHISGIKKYFRGNYMMLDESTISNLELLFTIRDSKKDGALLSVLDKTQTSMGARMLRSWLLKPLIDINKINARLDSVDEIFTNCNLRLSLANSLKNILDVERILGRLGCNSGNARDMIGLRESLKKIPEMKAILKNIKSSLLQNSCFLLGNFQELVDLLDMALIDEPSAMLKEGNMIKDGFHKELDELKSITRDSKSLIQSLQQREIERTQIPTLKIKFNSVFGYFIEVSKSHLKKVPDDYIRRQTVANAERFITADLKEYEEKILGAETKIFELEYQLFMELKSKVIDKISELQQASYAIATIDVLVNFAQIAAEREYVKPQITENFDLNISEGRHPVIELKLPVNNFISNDTALNSSKQIALITGPNMAGKSTYLRQTALIVLMAQIGSFVPAKQAVIPVCDRIFTRVGASDNLVKGQSTFMVEMQEASHILHNATEKSLIILDEIGRGTSTYDGISIACAIFEYIHDKICAKTLFATHYHELISVADDLHKGFNLSVLVKESDSGVVFLHKVVEGATDKSYGIEVAKLAGLPKDVIARALAILENLEEDHDSLDKATKTIKKIEKIDKKQLSFFSVANQREHKTIKMLEEVDPNNLSPIEALNKIYELKKSCEL